MALFLDDPVSPSSNGGSEIETTCLPCSASRARSKLGEWLRAREPQRLETTPAMSTNGLAMYSPLSTYASFRVEGDPDRAFAIWHDGERERKSDA